MRVNELSRPSVSLLEASARALSGDDVHRRLVGVGLTWGLVSAFLMTVQHTPSHGYPSKHFNHASA